MKKSLAGLALGLATLLAAPTAAGSQTPPGAELHTGDVVTSDSGRHRLVHQDDGNVVLYDDQGRALWQTGTAGTPTDRLIFQGDGNLVLYGDDGSPLWQTGTHGRGDVLVVQDDTNVVVYAADGTPVWDRQQAERRARALHAESVWDRLARCESGGNWHANTGNGYYGGLQWNPRSWNAFKDAGAPASAASASREQEIAAADRYRAYEQSQGRGGYGPWPSCARQLGLPR